jgi:hypothetical protein
MALTLRADLHLAPLHFERRIELRGRAVRIAELVKNLSSSDRPIAWTQHVTLGPPFLERGSTEFRSSLTRSKVFEQEFGSHAYLKAGEQFNWPMAPRKGGGYADLRVMNDSPASSAFTAHLADLRRDTAFFVAFSPSQRLALGYVWKSADFPWMGIWEENCSRLQPPWNGRALARGMEFGVSPFPESRRQMIERGRLFDIPTYRWIPAKGILEVEYWIVLQSADSVPETLSWPG